MKKIIIFLAILIPTVALLYFSLTRDPRTLPSTLVGKRAPDFTLESLDGEKTSLASTRGSPVVLNFWSTWCNTCEAEYQLLRRAAGVYSPQGVKFLEVLYEDTPQNAKAFIATQGESAPVLLDPGLKTSIDYGVSGVPETFFINTDGIILYKHSGMLTPGVLYTQLNRLTQERP